MRVVLFFDQIQAGAGGKEQTAVPLAVEKGGIGAYLTFQQYLDPSLTVIATTYSGIGYFQDNKAEVMKKMLGLLKKVRADLLLCGPCYNYEPYAEMAAQLAATVNEQLPECRAIVMCSQENEEIIEAFKQQVVMVKMPKKGGVGLSESFRHLSEVMVKVGHHQSLDDVASYVYE
ncbi:glycine reductase [Streptococcus cuniculi]|uniref:Glycine reductase n=1 Tax=Streptococcus cuniculi TaxID=1432788 RepID=A0A1Q8EAU5_9STRE|nr:GrdB-related putative oxidoreductase [Streptococcus cuniculi]OLF48929.1 glycine reductase [Streptococcus cuniculi]